LFRTKQDEPFKLSENPKDFYTTHNNHLFVPVPGWMKSVFTLQRYSHFCSRIPLTRINWDGEQSGYAENPDDWIFLWK